MNDRFSLVAILIFLFFVFGMFMTSSLNLPNTLDVVTSIGNTTNNTIGVGSIVIDESKYLRTVAVDGGDGLVFQSIDVLDEGGFPFIFVSQDNNNNTIVPFYLQTGRNNSASGIMNSFGLYPKTWVNFGMGDPLGRDLEGVEFLFNVSDYLKYCVYLQENLSLVDEGCKFFADTIGRKVPLFFTGDLEVHREAVIHEGLTVYDNFNFVGRDGKDVDLFFNGYNGGKLHIRETALVEGNFSIFTFTIADFDDGTLGFFEEVSPPSSVPNRIWRSVDEPECWNNKCGEARGGDDKTMQFSSSTNFVGGTVNVSEINLSFYLTLENLDVGESFYVELDDNEGNVSTIFSQTADTTDLFVNITFPDLFENKDNVTTRFVLNANLFNERVFVDEVIVVALPLEPIITNETYSAGQITLGQDTNLVDECYIRMEKQYNESSNLVEDFMIFKCANLNFIGNVTETDVTLENQTIIGDSNIQGDLYVDGEIYLKGVSINGTGLIGKTCAVNQILEWDGSKWDCTNDNDDQDLQDVLTEGNTATLDITTTGDITATDITATNIIFGGQTLSTLSTGTADNTKLVTQGYVDDKDLWEKQTATRIGLKSPYSNIRGSFDLEIIGQVVASTGDFTNLRASNFEPTSLITTDLTIDNGGTLEIKEGVSWTSISDLWIKWDNEEVKFGAGTNGDVRQYFSGSDFYIDSRDITANDELRFTDFDEYNFDTDVVVDGKLYFENSSNGYIEWIGGTNESIGFYNSSGEFTTIEVDAVYVHSFTTNLSDKEAYNLVENADDNNKSSWGECYNEKLVPDLTKPEQEYYDFEICEIELVEDCITKNESVWVFDGEFYQRGINETTTCEMVPNYEIEIVEEYQPFVNSTGYFIGYEKVNVEKKIPLPPVCINETRVKTIYPYEILSESLNLECKQTMMNKADNYRVKTQEIMAENIYTLSKVPNFNETYVDKLKDKTKLENKTTHYAYELIDGYETLNVEERIVALEGAVNEVFTLLCDKSILKKEDGCLK